MMMLFRSVFTGVFWTAPGSSTRCPRPYFCRILALAASMCAFCDLLFTVVIH